MMFQLILRFRAVLALIALGLFGAIGLYLGFSKPSLPGGAEPAPKYGKAPDFTLTTQDGTPLSKKDLDGAPWVAAFIFTKCRGQCPVMTARMRKLAEELPRVRFVSFSVDPGDTPQELKDFAKRYGATWTFVTGKGDEVQKLSREGFKLGAETGGGPEEPILHSSRLVLVDSDGYIRGWFDAMDPAGPEKLIDAATGML